MQRGAAKVARADAREGWRDEEVTGGEKWRAGGGRWNLEADGGIAVGSGARGGTEVGKEEEGLAAVGVSRKWKGKA